MGVFVTVFSTILLPVVLMAGAGFLVAHYGKVHPRPLVQVVYFIFSPCFVFMAMARSTVELDMLGRLALLTIGVMLLLGLAGRLVSLQLALPATTANAFLLGAVFANSGNYGLSVTQYAYGAEGLAFAVICFITGNLAVNSWGVYLAARGHTGLRQAVGQVFLNPGLYGVVLGLVANQLNYLPPAPVLRALETLGQAAVPGMLVILGIQLATLPLERKHWRIVGLSSALRLVVSPLLALPLAALLGLTGLAWQVALLESAVPSAVSASLIASRYDTEPNLVAGAVLVSTVASLLTVTALLSWMG